MSLHVPVSTALSIVVLFIAAVLIHLGLLIHISCSFRRTLICLFSP